MLEKQTGGEGPEEEEKWSGSALPPGPLLLASDPSPRAGHWYRFAGGRRLPFSLLAGQNHQEEGP